VVPLKSTRQFGSAPGVRGTPVWFTFGGDAEAGAASAAGSDGGPMADGVPVLTLPPAVRASRGASIGGGDGGAAGGPGAWVAPTHRGSDGRSDDAVTTALRASQRRMMELADDAAAAVDATARLFQEVEGMQGGSGSDVDEAWPAPEVVERRRASTLSSVGVSLSAASAAAVAAAAAAAASAAATAATAATAAPGVASRRQSSSLPPLGVPPSVPGRAAPHSSSSSSVTSGGSGGGGSGSGSSGSVGGGTSTGVPIALRPVVMLGVTKAGRGRRSSRDGSGGALSPSEGGAGAGAGMPSGPSPLPGSGGGADGSFSSFAGSGSLRAYRRGSLSGSSKDLARGPPAVRPKPRRASGACAPGTGYCAPLCSPRCS
jgi:hypothetical protein